MKKLLMMMVVAALADGLLTAATYDNPVLRENFPDPTFWDGGDGWIYGISTGIKKIVRSQDLVHWETINDAPLEKYERMGLESFSRNFWAPDAVKIGDEFRIYVTQFCDSPVNRLVCLASKNPQGPFLFKSVVLESWEKKINDIAIDSEVVVENGVIWLFTGSVTGGIWRTRLTPDGLHLDPTAPFEHVAGLVPPDCTAKWRPWVYSHACFEGSYLYKHGEYWYLFMSGGSVQVGYKLFVGRSKTLDGEFFDKSGKSLLEGGATKILETKCEEFEGPGHNGDIFVDKNGATFMTFHSHWAKLPQPDPDTAQPRCLNLQRIFWGEDGWPYFKDGAVQKTNEAPER